jgi:hypothetical protein
LNKADVADINTGMGRVRVPLPLIALGACVQIAYVPCVFAAPHDALIAKHAAAHGVPESLVRRVIQIESKGNPRFVSKGNYGLMQIRVGTARAMGYRGKPDGLLDPDTNMTYAVKYLAGAYRAAGCNESRAISLYQRGYYGVRRAKCLTPRPSPPQVADVAERRSAAAQRPEAVHTAAPDVLRPKVVHTQTILRPRPEPVREPAVAKPEPETVAKAGPAPAAIDVPTAKPVTEPTIKPVTAPRMNLVTALSISKPRAEPSAPPAAAKPQAEEPAKQPSAIAHATPPTMSAGQPRPETGTTRPAAKLPAEAATKPAAATLGAKPVPTRSIAKPDAGPASRQPTARQQPEQAAPLAAAKVNLALVPLPPARPEPKPSVQQPLQAAAKLDAVPIPLARPEPAEQAQPAIGALDTKAVPMPRAKPEFQVPEKSARRLARAGAAASPAPANEGALSPPAKTAPDQASPLVVANLEPGAVPLPAAKPEVKPLERDAKPSQPSAKKRMRPSRKARSADLLTTIKTLFAPDRRSRKRWARR